MAKESISFNIIKDFGAFGDGKWQKHLTLIEWGDNDPKYDIRPWNEDMTKMGKGVTLSDSELLDLYDLIGDSLGLSEVEEDHTNNDIYEEDEAE